MVHYLLKKLPECYGILRFIRMGERGGVYRVLVEKPEGKRPLGRPRHRWEDNTKIDKGQGLD
jgi:hypothetical protein